MRALEKDPAARFQSMAEMNVALADAQSTLGLRRPVAQIPRKGLHQRETFVRNSHKGGTIERALAQLADTPHDAGLPKRMAVQAEVAPTQLMDAVAPGRIDGMLESRPAAEPATMLDQRLPTAVRMAVQAAELGERQQIETERMPPPGAKPLQRSEPASQMSRDGAGNPTTGPQGMVPPRVVQASPEAASVPTRPSQQAPTAIRPVFEPEPDDVPPRAFPSAAGWVVAGALVVVVIALALALWLR